MSNEEQARVSRRALIAAGGGVAAAAVVGRSMVGPASADEIVSQNPATPVPIGDAIPPEVAQNPDQWVMAAGNYAGTRAISNSSINAGNAATLGAAWRVPLTGVSGYGAITSTSLIVGDTVYVQDMQCNFIAINRETGEIKWKTEFNVSTHGPNGLALGYGLLYGVLSNTGEVAAVSAETGELVWRVQLTNSAGESLTIAPVVYNGYVYVSTVPGNTAGPGWYTGGTKGILYALDAGTGNTLWQWDTTTDGLWGHSRTNSGGGLWYPVAIDVENNGQLYFGVGNASPFPGTIAYPNGTSRPGENLYAACMVSFDPNIGAVSWHIKPDGFDLFDLDFQNTPVLTTIPVFGVDTKVVIGSGKTGDVICAVAETGQIVWRQLVGKHQNDNLEVLPDDEYLEVYPGFNGAVQAPIAVANNTVFVPVNNWPTYYNSTGIDFTRIDESKSDGEFLALDAVTGEVKWHHYTPSLPLGAAAVANDVVFSAGTDGIVRAYNIEDGTEIWNFQLDAGVNAPVSIAGDTLIVGAGGPFMVKPGQFPNDEAPTPVLEVVAFKLDIGGGIVPEASPEAPAEAAATEEAPEAAAEQLTPVAGDDGVLALTVHGFDIGFRERNITIPADTDVALTFINEGAVQHDLDIVDADFNSGMLDGGTQSTITINLPAGEYRYLCTVPGHAQGGMAGTLTVA